MCIFIVFIFVFLLVFVLIVLVMVDSGGDIVFECMQVQVVKVCVVYQEKLVKQVEVMKKDKENC